MEQNLDQTIALLSRFPAAVDGLLRGLPGAWTLARESEGSWNCFDVLGHLVHLERGHWIVRVKQVLEPGEPRPFSPVDRFAQMTESEGKILSGLLDEFIRLRASNLDELRRLDLQPAGLARHGVHPSFGPVTLSEVLATWVAHDLTHLHQISRILASQYREAVGPWKAYLGVLKCQAHGE